MSGRIQDLFKLYRNGKPTVVAGVPPDYFSRTGQLWNLPLYRFRRSWPKINMLWWVDRLSVVAFPI